MINSASHDNVSRLVTDRSMCFATALDKAFENIDCMSAILRCQAKRIVFMNQLNALPYRVEYYERDIIRQVCREMGVQIIEGVLSSDHTHMFVSVPPHVAISDLMQRAKGRSSYKIQMEFPEIRKRYWGRRFWPEDISARPVATSLMTS